MKESHKTTRLTTKFLSSESCSKPVLSRNHKEEQQILPDNPIETVQINLEGCCYPTFVGRSLLSPILRFLLENSGDKKILIVSDTKLSKIYGERLFSVLEGSGFEVTYFLAEAEKKNKTMDRALEIMGVLERKNFSRDSCVIALGGGVIGDLAGFVASCWYRGMNLLHVPTTLVAMVDSSIGGKCAVNFNKTTNAIGAYHHPIANFVDLHLLDELPVREFRSGMAEIIKCALIADVEFFWELNCSRNKILSGDEAAIRSIILKTIQIKEKHVANDVRENDKRLLLNFGHTLGHAIEMATQGEEECLRHGEAVALGISAILAINHKYFGLSKSDVDQARAALFNFDLPINFESSKHGLERESLLQKCMDLVSRDKKRKGGVARLILLRQLGSAYVHSCDDQNIIRYGFESVIC